MLIILVTLLLEEIKNTVNATYADSVMLIDAAKPFGTVALYATYALIATMSIAVLTYFTMMILLCYTSSRMAEIIENGKHRINACIILCYVFMMAIVTYSAITMYHVPPTEDISNMVTGLKKSTWMFMWLAALLFCCNAKQSYDVPSEMHATDVQKQRYAHFVADEWNRKQGYLLAGTTDIKKIEANQADDNWETLQIAEKHEKDLDAILNAIIVPENFLCLEDLENGENVAVFTDKDMLISKAFGFKGRVKVMIQKWENSYPTVELHDMH